MIPKIIHYCWFGGKPKPELAQKCIRSWEKFCPDYQIIEWNESRFSLADAPLYVRQAYEAGRWAFVTDYVRLVALTQMGGVYMDTDVEVIRPLDPFLKHQGFAGLETEDRIQTGLLACEPGFPLFLEFLHYYDSAVFLRPDGSEDTTTNVQVLTQLCRQRGFSGGDRLQVIDGLAIYPREVFCPVDYDTQKLKKTRKTVVIHWFLASWHTQEEEAQLEAERQQRRQEQRSQRRVAIGTALLGQRGYAALKRLLKISGE